MNVYTATPVNGLEWVLPCRDEDFEYFWRLDGTSRLQGWSPISMRLVSEDEGEVLRRADMPWFGRHVIVLRKNAITILGGLLEEHGEILPLACAEADLYVFNALRVIDALDIEESQVTWLPSGSIMDMESLVLRGDAIDGPLIFKLPQTLRGPLYFTQPVVTMIEMSGLSGMSLKRVATTDQ